MSKNEIIGQIKKRSGVLVDFDLIKISNAISRAFSSCGKTATQDEIDIIGHKVVDKLGEQGFSSDKHPTVEDVQNLVESSLIDSGFSDVAKQYILYRAEHDKLREDKLKLLNAKTLDSVAKKFDIQCLKVLASRYLFRDGKNEIKEQPVQLFDRVSLLVGIADMLYSPDVFDVKGSHEQDIDEAKSYLKKLDNFDNKFHIGKYYLNKWHFRSLIDHYVTLAEQGRMKCSFKEILSKLALGKLDQYEEKINEYFNLMVTQDFLPNTPTLMNAGGRLGQLSACFVLDMQDNLGEIMKTARDAALIFQSGGGVGINYSDLREEGDIVASTSGVASGPVSFMEIVNTVTDVIKQGGKRRGANMGIVEVWHPDVEQFISRKQVPGVLENFNVSVGVWEDFWKAVVSDDGKYMLRSPRDHKPIKEINAHKLIDSIANSAHASAEPGLIFFDNINKYNVFAKARGGPLRATNPCGEQSLYPHESCNLGSINLSNFAKRDANGEYEFDWSRYEEVIRKTTRFLDNVIDVNNYPIPEINKASKDSRRIGLGVMGVADLLYKLKMPYNSAEGYEFQSNLAEALTYFSMDESITLARERGEFPLCSKTEYPEGKIPIAGYYEKEIHYDWDALVGKIMEHGIRNVLTTTVAPTGTLSMLADCSGGMEPQFALSFEKQVTVGKFFYANKVLRQVLEEAGLYSEELLEKIANNYGSVKGLDEIPKEIQNVFVTAMDIHWSDHLMAQGVWQDWIGNAISKTINMPHDGTSEDVKAAYLLAHDLGLKGITVYRDGSRQKQVLHMSDKNATKLFDVTPSDVLHAFIKTHPNEYVRNQILDAVTKVSIEQPLVDSETDFSMHEATETSKDDDEKECPTCSAVLLFKEGCSVCIECGYSGCSSG
jgi:ribonucleoside-diphosphate reductase alpha chain